MNMSKKNLILGTVIIILVVIIGGISITKNNHKESFKIGFFGPITGALGVSTGESIFQAFQLANEQRPSIDGRKVEVVYEDDVCDPKKAVAAAQKLITIDKVDAIVSSLCSGPVFSTAKLADENKIVMLSPGAAAPSITTAGDYVFRLSASSVTGGKAAAKIIEKDNYKKIGIIVENNEYPIGWKDSFVKEMSAKTDVKIFAETAALASIDVRSQILKIVAQKPDVIFVHTLTPTMANALLNQLHELNVKIPIIANEVFSLQSVIHNPNAEGVMITVYKYSNNSPEFAKFLADYKARFKKDIQEDIYGAMAYDAYNLMLDAKLQCGNAGGECIKNFLYNTQNRAGLSGSINIDQNGDSNKEFVLKVVKGGKITDIQ